MSCCRLTEPCLQAGYWQTPGESRAWSAEPRYGVPATAAQAAQGKVFCCGCLFTQENQLHSWRQLMECWQNLTSRQSIGHPSPTSAKACTTGVLFSLPPSFLFFLFFPPIFFSLKIHVWKLCSLQCRLTYEHCSKHTCNISFCRTKGAVSIDTGVN